MKKQNHIIYFLLCLFFVSGCSTMTPGNVRSVRRLRTGELGFGGSIGNSNVFVGNQMYGKMGIFQILDICINGGNNYRGGELLLHLNKDSKYFPELALGLSRKYWVQTKLVYVDVGGGSGGFDIHGQTNSSQLLLIKYIGKRSLLYSGYSNNVINTDTNLKLSNTQSLFGIELSIGDNSSIITEIGEYHKYDIVEEGNYQYQQWNYSYEHDDVINELPHEYYFGIGICCFFDLNSD